MFLWTAYGHNAIEFLDILGTVAQPSKFIQALNLDTAFGCF